MSDGSLLLPGNGRSLPSGGLLLFGSRRLSAGRKGLRLDKRKFLPSSNLLLFGRRRLLLSSERLSVGCKRLLLRGRKFLSGSNLLLSSGKEAARGKMQHVVNAAVFA